MTGLVFPPFFTTEMPGILLQRPDSNDPGLTASNDVNDSNQASEDGRSVIEIRSDEFPSYFTERRARLFSSNPTPYLLPVDTPEQEVSTFLVLF